MAFEERLETISARSGSDLSAASNQYKIVKLNSSGDAVLCTAVTDKPVGILQNKPKQNQAATIAVGGISKCQASAAVTAGNLVGTSTGAQAQTAVTTQYPIGKARTSVTNAGEIFSVLVQGAGSALI